MTALATFLKVCPACEEVTVSASVEAEKPALIVIAERCADCERRNASAQVPTWFYPQLSEARRVYARMEYRCEWKPKLEIKPFLDAIKKL